LKESNPSSGPGIASTGLPPALERILVVEDERDIQIVARLALVELGGFEVRIVASGAEAFAVAAEFVPQMILLDVMLPEMDGWEVMRRLRTTSGGKRPEVVILTALAEASTRDRLLAEGASEVIVKPFDPLTLATQLRAVWASRRVPGAPASAPVSDPAQRQ